jgi:hypothetical protein
MTIAYVRLLQKQPSLAIDAAVSSLSNSRVAKVQFLAARILVDAGQIERARELAEKLRSEFEKEPQAYATIVDGDIALKTHNPREAVNLFVKANGLFDTWVGHFVLGRAYLEAGAFTQSDSEFDRCIARRGEALALFLDEEPTYGYFMPDVYYFQGRVREGMKSARFSESYQKHLAIRGTSSEDAIAAEVRRRMIRDVSHTPESN